MRPAGVREKPKTSPIFATDIHPQTMGPVTMSTDMQQISNAGGQKLTDQLWSYVYNELRRVAHEQMTRELPGQTLQPTALVHEVYLRLQNSGSVRWQSRGHFFAAAAEAMRRILIERARAKQTVKRTPPGKKIPLETVLAKLDESTPDDFFALDDALGRLRKLHARKAEIVRLKYFAGLTHEEIAESLGLSLSTVRSDWRFARAWLHLELKCNG